MFLSTELPGISLEPQKLIQKVGGKASFTCILTEESVSIKFEWLKNGQILHPSPKIGIGSSEWSSTLVLKSISALDAGNYTCRASNSQGSSQSNSILVVEGNIRSRLLNHSLIKLTYFYYLPIRTSTMDTEA